MSGVRDARALPPEAQLIQMAIGSVVSATVCAAAELGIADRLADGPKTAEELAGPLGGLHSPALHRFMRSLAGFGILTEGEGQAFGLTPLGAALKSDAPGSARSTLRTLGGPLFTRTLERFDYSLKTGEPAFDDAFGMPFFEYLSKHPDDASRFSETMVGFHGSEPPTVAEAYDFSQFGTVVDVGGATGNMLAHILSRHAGVRGVLFDQAHVVGEAPAFLKARGVADRVTIESGSFFEGVPAGGDAYIVSHIIHDWTEAQCLTILSHIRQALAPGGRVLIVETVLPPGDTPHQGKLQDMVMLLLPGGRERTEEEYRDLLARAGLRLTKVVPTTSVVSIVEAVPA